MEVRQNKAVLFLFITVLIDIIGLGIIIPIIPSLIQELTGASVSGAASYAVFLVFSYSLMQFIFSPILGGISDYYGRRPVLLFSLLGFGLDYLLLAFAPNIAWLFIARIISGITGASFTTANAYVADVVPAEKRTQSFGLMGAAFGLGFIVGPALGGILGEIHLRLPFFVAAGLSLLNLIYGYFVLPESLPLDRRRAFDFKRANPIGSFKNLRKYPYIMYLLGSMFLFYIANYATQSTWAFYTIEKFGWSEFEVGLSLGFVGLMVALVQGGIIRIVIPKIGLEKSLILGLFINGLGLALFGFASQSWMMYIVMIVYAFGGLGGPSFQGIITNHVDANQQGELQGVLTSLVSFSAIIGQPMMLGLFRYFSNPRHDVYLPGAPFLLGSVLSFISLGLTIVTINSEKSKNEIANFNIKS